MGADGAALPSGAKRIVPGSEVVFDAVYRPKETGLLVEARRSGAKVIHGEDMLLHQGMAAFKLWTGRGAPESEMREALVAALKGGQSPSRKKGGRKSK